jgi:hypothetical protein
VHTVSFCSRACAHLYMVPCSAIGYSHQSDQNMDIDANMEGMDVPQDLQQQTVQAIPAEAVSNNTGLDPAPDYSVHPLHDATEPPHAPTPPVISSISSPRDFRDIQVKIHIRRPEKDSWTYLGRGTVSQEITGHSSRISECFSTNACSYKVLTSCSHSVISFSCTNCHRQNPRRV